MRYFNAKEAAEYVGKSEKTIRRWIESGHLKARKEGGKFLISKRALDTLKGHLNGLVSSSTSEVKGQIADKEWLSIDRDILFNTNEIINKLQDILEEIRSAQVFHQDESPLIAGLRQDRDQLWEQNAKLFALLGQSQQENEQLKDRIRMLEASKEGKKRRRWWWLSGRGGSDSSGDVQNV